MTKHWLQYTEGYKGEPVESYQFKLHCLATFEGVFEMGLQTIYPLNWDTERDKTKTSWLFHTSMAGSQTPWQYYNHKIGMVNNVALWITRFKLQPVQILPSRQLKHFSSSTCQQVMTRGSEVAPGCVFATGKHTVRRWSRSCSLVYSLIYQRNLR